MIKYTNKGHNTISETNLQTLISVTQYRNKKHNPISETDSSNQTQKPANVVKQEQKSISNCNNQFQ